METKNTKHTERRKRFRYGKIVSAIVAIVLVLTMAVGLLPNNGGKVYAKETAADAETRSDYSWSLGDVNSTQYNGRVWTDKSVSDTDVTFGGDAGSVTVPIGTGDDASDFLVTYSALATSQEVSGESNVPVDVVFVIDLSGSMSNSDSYMDNHQKRIQNLVTALNASINELMDMNSENRIGVVGYSSTATTILPLDHYTPNGYSQNIFSYNDNQTRLSWDARNSSNQRVNNNISVTGGTNTQMGIYQGMNMLASESDTTVTVGGQEMQRVPSVIVMADGAATYSSDSSQWWSPANNNNDGPGSRAYYGNGMKAMMTASYMKQAINRNYVVEDTSSSYAAKVYTIGIGTADLGGDDEDLANITLNPKDHWNDNNDMANSIRDAWNGVEAQWPWEQNQEGYISNNGTGTPNINVGAVSGRYYNDDWYKLTHPQQNDIVEVGLQYNDAYYDAITADDVNEIFDDIVSSIAISTPQVPTKIEGNDPVHDGYITYTDVIGDYMEVDSVKELIWAGQEFKNPKVSGEGTADVTYTFEGEIDNPAYENAQNANQIQITVHTDTAADGTKTQTMTVKIPATAIPLRVNTVELGENEQGDTTVVSNTSNNAYPLRLVYGVSLQDGINPDTLEGVSEDYIAANTDEDGKVNFYSNKYSGNTQGEGDAAKTVGDAKVEFTPADDNPYYFLQEDTPIYMNQTGDQRVTQDQFNENGTYWVPVTYYDGNSVINTRVERTGASMADYIQYEEGENWWDPSYAYITAGAPRLGNIEQFIKDKTDNNTDTAETSFYPTFEGTDVHDGKFVVYLGNNGKLQLDAPASLIIGKNVTADEGLTAPDATFTFEITSADKAGQSVSAVKTTGTGESASTENTEVQFNDQGVATVELTADQTIELKGMAGADYSIKEVNIAGGFALSNVEGAATTSGSGNDTVASGEVNTGAADETVTFTNNYSVTPATSTGLNIPLSGSKAIDGRDFQAGDEFTFTIAAAQATPDAPLPQKDGADVTSVTINPTSGETADFAFDGEITFTEPGEYRYIIRETQGNLAGVDYDAAVFRLNIVIVDNGDGTLRLANVDEIGELTAEDGMAGDGLVYTANPMIQEYNGGTMQPAPNNAVQFDNNYNSDAATATIQGTKLLNKIDTDYQLKDGDFTFTIAALGSTKEAKDSYTADDFVTDNTQPMPVDDQGQPLTETVNIANGNVQFSFAQNVFTQDMVGKTFGYQITEALGDAPDNTTMDSNTIRIVWVTVGDDGQGHVTTTVGPNDGQSGTPNNFTFTNSYEPTSTTIGDGGNAGITVQKTFEGHTWTDDYTFEYTIKNTGAPDGVTAPMPEKNTIEIGNPESGKVNTNAFGAMTFEQEGTYTYEITETKGNHGGVTYDEHVATVTVTVTEDEAAGTLSAQVAYNNSAALNDSDKAVQDAAAFTNTYNASFAEGTTVNLDGTKNLTVGANSDRTLAENQFFAVVTPLDGAPYGDKVISPGSSSYTVGNAADDKADNGTFSGAFSGLLSNVKFSLSDLDGAASKDFVYLISEQQSGATGVTYDNAVYQVTITVTDDGNGKLSAGSPVIVKGTMQDDAFVADADQSGVNGVVFNNSYTPNPADAVAAQTLKKVLSGDREQPLQAGEFEFKIELSDGDASGVTLPDPATVTNDADGNINFGNIMFTKAGIYKIKATEVVPEDAVDNGDGTYTLNHITYDTHTIETTFKVTDQNGKLTVNRTSVDGSTTFTNTYKPDETTTTDDTTVNTNILVTKEVTGAPATEAFTFSLNLAEGQDSSNVFEGTGDDKTVFDGVEVTTSDSIAAGATETKAFAGVTFTAAGDYRFVIDETTTTEEPGWNYDGKTVEITVHVADQDGQLVITGIDNNNQTFTNSYVPNSVTLSGDSGLKATKSVTGAPAPSEFEFNLALTSENAGNVLVGSGEDATAFPESGITMSTQDLFDEDTATGSEDTTETVNFGDLTFTATGVYTFTVTEITSTEPDGWTYGSGSGAVITVTVTDDNYDGQLDATTVVTQGEGESATQIDTNNPTITNSYVPGSVDVGEGEASGPVQVTKNISGAPAPSDFSFTLTFDGDAAGNTGSIENIKGLSDGSITTSVSQADLDDNNETASFGKLTFTAEGDYYFTVTENETAPNSGWTYDNAPKTVIIHVTDTDHDGYLEASVDDDAAVVNNSYSPSGVVVGDDEEELQVTKQVTGAPALSEFDFTLQLTSDNAANVQGLGENNSITKSTQDMTGKQGDETETVNFGDLTFTAEGDYVFTVTETTTTEAAGWTYDNAAKTITVHVTDDGYDGQLDATVEGNNPTVMNSYSPTSVVVGDDEEDLQVTKQVTGAPALSEFEFTLQLTSDNAANVQGLGVNNSITMSTTGLTGNEGSETVNFGKLTFTAAGDYTFTVDETTTTEEDGWTYDNSVKTITVHVTDENYDGQLDVTVEGNNPIFYNTYYKPEDAKSVQDADGNNIDGQLVGVGDELTYTIDWVNNAVDEDGVPVNADVVITDSVPTGTTLVAGSISEGGVEQDDTITWTFEDQAPGASGQVSFKVTVDEPENGDPAEDITNSADITIGENDPQTSTVTNPLPGKEEITNPGQIGEGTVLTYQISFTNTDGDGASAEVVDTLTRGQGYNADSATVQIGDGEAFSMEPATTGDAASGQTLTWNLTDLPDNAEVVITFDVTVTRDAGASVDNTATVNGHNTNTTTTPYPSDSKKDVANADEPTVSIDGKLAGVGDTLIYTIDWAAEADGTLTITDKIPDGTAYVEDSADNKGVYVKETNTITWTFEDLEEGDKGTVTFEVTITEDAVNYDEISNTASLQIGDNDPKTTNEVTTDIPKKEVTDTTPDTGIQVGDTLTYTIEYRNDTNETATVTVTDTLPAGLTYTGVPDGQTEPVVTTGDDGRQVLTWIFENVEPSDTASTVTFNTVVNENATIVEDPVRNKATVTVGENDYDTNTTGGDVKVQTGNLTISKEIVLTEGQGTEIDTDKEFTFTVTLTGTNDQPLTGTYQYQIGDGKAQDLDFNDDGQATLNLKHNESATITGLPEGANYTVTEADYTADGYTTTVPDNASAKIMADGVTVDFTNTYKPSGVIIGGDDTEAGITVQKTFTGRDWTADDSFEFTIENTEKPESVETAPMPEQTTVTIGAEGAADGVNSAAFSAMSFDTIGEYVYEITETHTGETIEGITYDAHTATVTVNVTDAGDGKLQAEVTYDNSEAETEADQAVENAAAFTNTYEPGDITIGGEDTQAGIMVQKTLAGRAWETDDRFEFTLSAETKGAPTPDSTAIGISGTAGEETPARAAFGEMTFTKDMMDGQMTKDFVYTVTETSTGGNGVTVDPSTERTVTVTVTDDGKGNLSAEVKYNNAEASTDTDKTVTDAAAFTNTYDAQAAESVPANFTLTKVFEGHDWTENYTFQFRLTPVDGAPMPAADENAGVIIADDGSAVKTVSGPQEDGTASFDFGAITYETAGDYTYTVTEIGGDNPGVIYSGNTATVTVHVTDKGDAGASTGQLVASASVVNGTFTNTYKTGEVAYDTAAGLQIVKNMTGRAISADEFTFTMTGADEGSIARLNNGKALEFKTTGAGLTGNSATETINALTGLTFTQADVGNTYTYTVKETIPDGAADNGNGTYTLNGMTYDGTSYEVQFVVTEDGEGTLLVETFVDGVSQGITQGAVATNVLPAQLVFNNSYDAGTTTVGASGEAQIQAVKVLNNDDIANYAGQFHFSVTGSNNVKVASGINDASGNITFSDIVYNTENLNAAVTAEGSNEVGKATVDRTGDQDVYTFNYTVSEDTLDPESGVSYNGGTFGVTVTVTDDRAGKLTVAVAYDNGGNNLTFENTYGADSEFNLTLTGNKVISAAEGLNPPTLTGGEYQFTIVGSEGAPMPETTTVSNQGATVSFGPITYTMENVFGSEEETVTEDTTEDVTADTAEAVTADETASDDTAADVVADETEADGGAAVQTAGRTKVFTYTISESGELAGVTNEEGTKTVEVTVTDMGGGELTAVVTNVAEGTQDGSDFTFTNTYSVTPEESTPTGDGVEGGVTITKTIDGRNLNEGEFTFQMADAEGNVVSEGTNDAAGNVELGGITFEKPGTYSYTIHEVNNGLGGVTYDTSVYTATATVTDDQDGTLSVAWEVKAAGGEALDAVTFANSYTAAPTSVSLGAAKKLDGRALKDGEFTFELKDEDGNVVSSAKNDENGAVVFDTISFDKAGTYKYTVTEAAGSDATITYDNTVYNVTITVTDDGNGSLSASVDTGDKTLVFTNKYTKPAEPQKPDDSSAAPADGTPKAVQTGDTTPIMPAVIAVIASLAAIAAVVVIIMRRRRR